jgi:transaldolase
MFPTDPNPAALIARRRAMQEINTTKKGKKLVHPAAHAPRIFVDSAAIDDIRPLVEAGIVNGVTTNPSLLKKAGASSWDEAKEMLTAILELCHPNPVSLELTKLKPDEMIAQAEELAALGANSVIKVPTGGYQAVDEDLDPHTGLKVIRRLWEKDIKVNATLIFNSAQAFWAANAGASYVSPFMGRLADYMYKNDHPERPGGNSLYYIENHRNDAGDQNVFNTEYVASGGDRKDSGVRLVREIATVFANYDIHSEVLAASVRNASQLMEVMVAGADILTVPADILMGVADHPLSDEGMMSFYEDSQAFSE